MPDTMMTPETPAYRNRSPEIAKLAASLVKAQAAMEGAKKDSENPHFKNAYADLASVWDAVRKPLTDNGLSVIQFPRTSGNGVEIETTLLHTSGEFMCDVLWVPCSKNDAQGLGSAITYGRRYALMAVTGIAPVDDDGNAAAAGMAGGGGEFRPPGPRKFTGQMGTGDMKAEAERDGLTKPQADKPANGKKTAAEKAKEWTDTAIKAIGISGQTVQTLKKFEESSKDKLDWLESNAPEQHERFYEAFNEAKEAANAKVAA